MKARSNSSTLSLTSTLDLGGWSAPRTARFTSGKRPVTHCTERGQLPTVQKETSYPLYRMRPVTHCTERDQLPTVQKETSYPLYRKRPVTYCTERDQLPTVQKETSYPLYRKLGGPQWRSGRVQKISSPPGFDSRTAQPAASRYTNYAVPAHIHTE
jgi:hypothetical protein